MLDIIHYAIHSILAPLALILIYLAVMVINIGKRIQEEPEDAGYIAAGGVLAVVIIYCLAWIILEIAALMAPRDIEIGFFSTGTISTAVFIVLVPRFIGTVRKYWNPFADAEKAAEAENQGN